MTAPAATLAPAARRYTVRDRDGNVVGKAELRSVPIHVVKIDSAYQREVSTHWVHEHMPFDPRRAGAIVLSGRSGGPYCIDGGHRLALARESGVPQINAFVVDGLTQADEARLFTQYQRERRNLTSFALFRADQVAGDPATLAMVRIVHNAGFHLAKTAGPLNITAIDAVRYIHRYGDDDLLARTLELVKRLWFDEEKALSGQLLKGLALFLSSAGSQPSFRRERLEKVMSVHAPTKILRLSQGVAERRKAFSVNSPANVAEALKEQYDKLATHDDEKLGPLTIGSKRRPSPRGTRA